MRGAESRRRPATWSASRWVLASAVATLSIQGGRGQAGGIMQHDPELEARWAAAEEQAALWEKAGAKAAPAMLSALCGEDELLAKAASVGLRSLGQGAIAPLVQAAWAQTPAGIPQCDPSKLSARAVSHPEACILHDCRSVSDRFTGSLARVVCCESESTS